MRLLLLLALLSPAALPAGQRPVEFSASGISLPFFDASGRLTHRLTARSGVMVGPRQNLQEVELTYFSAADPATIVQRIVAADATWDAGSETLTGGGALTVTTEQSKLTGEGFDFALATALLHFHRKFTMTHPESVLTSDRATVELVVEQTGDERKVRDVKACEAIGHLHIVVAPAAQEKFKLEEAWSDRARYDGATQIITFPEPTRYLVKGRTGEAKVMTINLAPQKK